MELQRRSSDPASGFSPAPYPTPHPSQHSSACGPGTCSISITWERCQLLGPSPAPLTQDLHLSHSLAAHYSLRSTSQPEPIKLPLNQWFSPLSVHGNTWFLIPLLSPSLKVLIELISPGCSPSIRTVQFSSVAQSCLTLCNPMNRSTPGLPVHHQLPEFTQTHIH